MSEQASLGRFGHHPDPACDFCVEVEELEAIAESARLGLTGYGHEAERETLDERIEEALNFRVGADEIAVNAKAHLRKLAVSRGFSMHGTIAYDGQPWPRSAQVPVMTPSRH